MQTKTHRAGIFLGLLFITISIFFAAISIAPASAHAQTRGVSSQNLLQPTPPRPPFLGYGGGPRAPQPPGSNAGLSAIIQFFGSVFGFFGF